MWVYTFVLYIYTFLHNWFIAGVYSFKVAHAYVYIDSTVQTNLMALAIHLGVQESKILLVKLCLSTLPPQKLQLLSQTAICNRHLTIPLRSKLPNCEKRVMLVV